MSRSIIFNIINVCNVYNMQWYNIINVLYSILTYKCNIYMIYMTVQCSNAIYCVWMMTCYYSIDIFLIFDTDMIFAMMMIPEWNIRCKWLFWYDILMMMIWYSTDYYCDTWLLFHYYWYWWLLLLLFGDRNAVMIFWWYYSVDILILMTCYWYDYAMIPMILNMIPYQWWYQYQYDIKWYIIIIDDTNDDVYWLWLLLFWWYDTIWYHHKYIYNDIVCLLMQYMILCSNDCQTMQYSIYCPY